MKVLGPIVPSGSCSAPWSPGWRCCPLPALAVGARQFCSVDGVPVQSAAIALHSAPGARRLEIGGALVAAALASKMAGIYAIQAMESAEGAVDAPAGTEAETVVDRLAAQNVRSFREHHGLMVDDDFAYAFSSWEEAAANAGHAVADAWPEISHEMEDDAVMGLVDGAVAAGMSSGAAARPVVRLSKMASLWGRWRLRGRRSPRPEELFMDAGARQPRTLGGRSGLPS